jgi:DNA-binding NtrC family response regulator
VQVKLLHVLQERAFFPVGGHEPARFEGRVLAATNRPLEAMRREGRFRDDLYYRLCSDEIVLPPLRERLREAPEELGALVRSILARIDPGAGGGEAGRVLSSLAETVGEGYPWPGNVRELEQAVKRVVLSGRYEGSRAPAPGGEAGRIAAGIEAGSYDAEGLLSAYCSMLHRRLGSYEAVARATGLDRRTVRKRILPLDTGHSL